jgi:hypothetical protein
MPEITANIKTNNINNLTTNKKLARYMLYQYQLTIHRDKERKSK